jgi:MerR family transcriptional regulator, light-induced transcriptional regulator
MESSRTEYSIRQVIELTGVSEFLLRVWENRYKALQPKRTKTGRRLYSQDDVLRARMLFELSERGIKIGQTARLSADELNELLAKTSTERYSPSPARRPSAARERTLARLFVASDLFDWDSVRIYLKPGEAGAEEHLHELLIPAALELNSRVDEGSFSIAHEHIFTALLKEAIAAIPNPKFKKRRHMRMVFATPEGDYHELGLIFAAKIAALAGADTLMLGPNVPKRDLGETCLRFDATHLVLSSSLSRQEGAKDDLLRYVNFLDRGLPARTRLWLAGRNAAVTPVKLERPVRLFESFEPFAAEINND